jgi:hypothetical protein
MGVNWEQVSVPGKLQANISISDFLDFKRNCTGHEPVFAQRPRACRTNSAAYLPAEANHIWAVSVGTSTGKRGKPVRREWTRVFFFFLSFFLLLLLLLGLGLDTGIRSGSYPPQKDLYPRHLMHTISQADLWLFTCKCGPSANPTIGNPSVPIATLTCLAAELSNTFTVGDEQSECGHEPSINLDVALE